MKKTGSVKWYNPVRGFGFIVPDGGGSDVFLHVTDVKRSGLKAVLDGMRVSFTVAEHNGKTVARELEVLDELGS